MTRTTAPILPKLALLTAAALAGVGLAACSSAATSTPSVASSAGSSVSPANPATTITAGLSEFTITLNTTAVSPGRYTFVATNQGTITHALSVTGPGVADSSTGDLRPGASASLTVTLAPGRYDVFCPVGNHRMEGMDRTMTVG